MAQFRVLIRRVKIGLCLNIDNRCEASDILLNPGAIVESPASGTLANYCGKER